VSIPLLLLFWVLPDSPLVLQLVSLLFVLLSIFLL
jgi:hypothetical protein